MMADSGAPKSFADFVKKTGLSESEARGMLFLAVDFLIEAVDQRAIDTGMYNMPPRVSDKSLKEAYQNMLWATYEIAEGIEPEAPGLWVSLDHTGIHVSQDRP